MHRNTVSCIPGWIEFWFRWRSSPASAWSCFFGGYKFKNQFFFRGYLLRYHGIHGTQGMKDGMKHRSGRANLPFFPSARSTLFSVQPVCSLCYVGLWHLYPSHRWLVQNAVVAQIHTFRFRRTTKQTTMSYTSMMKNGVYIYIYIYILNR